jgi:hypothetical protein
MLQEGVVSSELDPTQFPTGELQEIFCAQKCARDRDGMEVLPKVRCQKINRANGGEW